MWFLEAVKLILPITKSQLRLDGIIVDIKVYARFEIIMQIAPL